MSSLRSPKELGFRFPAEWEPQEAVWFAWPTRPDLWEGVLDRVREQLAALYVLAARFEPVRVLCPAGEQEELRALMEKVGDSSAVEVFDYETDDVWCRDFGPLFLLSEDGSELAMADWKYNAWGNKFPKQEKDNLASAWIAEQIGIRRFAFDTVLEGGGIESNGAGQVLTTEAVLLNPNRNGAMSKEANAALITDGLGAEEVLWLKDGLAGDDTDGHIDNLARFFREDGILLAEASTPEDRNAGALGENLHRIEGFKTAGGKQFTVVPLPLPTTIESNGEPLAASYLNYLVLNGGVIVPTYDQPSNDTRAIEIIGTCFPDREIVGFDCRDIILEGGAIHCMSQHQPAVL